MRSAGKVLAIAALGALLGGPAFADCPHGQREFRGALSAVGPRKLFVESRFEDNIGFERADETRVVGAKARWEALAPGDVVAICWRFEDRPRRALMITVLK